MSIELLQALLPVLCVVIVAAGIVLDRRVCRPAPSAAAIDAIGPDERFALRLVADSLIRSLQLRPECRAEVLAELLRERPLVLAWLARQSGAPAPRAVPVSPRTGIEPTPTPAAATAAARPARHR